MQPRKHKIALLVGALILGASSAANAAIEPFKITAKALPDVSIDTVTAMNYNTNLFIASGATCLMNATVPGSASTALMQYDTGTALVAPANYGTLSGTACVGGTGKGTPGVYKITGLAGATVKVTISNSVTTGDVSFSPNSGCIVNYSGDSTAAGDTCVAFIPGTLTTKKLSAAVGTENIGTPNAGAGVPIGGQLMFTVGGTLTVNNTLTPNLAGVVNYNVEVVY